jgi:hypothetical protein
VVQAYSHRQSYKGKKGVGNVSGLRRASKAPLSAKSLSVGPNAPTARSKFGYESGKYTYNTSKYRND